MAAVVHILVLHAESSRDVLLATNCIVYPLPLAIVKDLRVAFAVYVGYAVLMVRPLHDPDNCRVASPLVTPQHIQPEWYFLLFYTVIRSIPSKLSGLASLVELGQRLFDPLSA